MEIIRKATKYGVKDCVKMAVLDQVMADDLRGTSSNPFAVFEGLFNNDDDIIEYARMNKNNSLLLNAQYRRYFSSFWKGDYESLESHSKTLNSLP